MNLIGRPSSTTSQLRSHLEKVRGVCLADEMGSKYRNFWWQGLVVLIVSILARAIAIQLPDYASTIYYEHTKIRNHCPKSISIYAVSLDEYSCAWDLASYYWQKDDENIHAILKHELENSFSTAGKSIYLAWLFDKIGDGEVNSYIKRYPSLSNSNDLRRNWSSFDDSGITTAAWRYSRKPRISKIPSVVRGNNLSYLHRNFSQVSSLAWYMVRIQDRESPRRQLNFSDYKTAIPQALREVPQLIEVFNNHQNNTRSKLATIPIRKFPRFANLDIEVPLLALGLAPDGDFAIDTGFDDISFEASDELEDVLPQIIVYLMLSDDDYSVPGMTYRLNKALDHFTESKLISTLNATLEAVQETNSYGYYLYCDESCSAPQQSFRTVPSSFLVAILLSKNCKSDCRKIVSSSNEKAIDVADQIASALGRSKADLDDALLSKFIEKKVNELLVPRDRYLRQFKDQALDRMGVR